MAAVGLTGGIGAGKSTALRLFAEAGALTLSADEVVHQLYAREDVKQALAGHFGREVLDARGRGGQAASGRGGARAARPSCAGWRTSPTPWWPRRCRRFIGEAPAGSVVVCEVPLLFEAGMERCFDLVVTIEAGREIRRRRSVHDFGLEHVRRVRGPAGLERAAGGGKRPGVRQRRRRWSDLREFVRQAYERARLMAVGGEAMRTERRRRRRRRLLLSGASPIVAGGRCGGVWRVAAAHGADGGPGRVGEALSHPLRGRDSGGGREVRRGPVPGGRRGAGPRAASIPRPSPAPERWASCSSCPTPPSGSPAWTAGRGPRIPRSRTPQDSLELGACYLAYLLRTVRRRRPRPWPPTTPARATSPTGSKRPGAADTFGPDDIQFPETREFVRAGGALPGAVPRGAPGRLLAVPAKRERV